MSRILTPTVERLKAAATRIVQSVVLSGISVAELVAERELRAIHADYLTLHAEKEQQRAILAELVDVYERIAANLGGPKAHSYAEAMMDVVADLRALVDPPQQKET